MVRREKTKPATKLDSEFDIFVSLTCTHFSSRYRHRRVRECRN